MSKRLKWWTGFVLTAIPITLIYASVIWTVLMHMPHIDWLNVGGTVAFIAALIVGCILMSSNH